MPKKIAVSTLNASTIDILNTIRANASAQYQSSVPTISQTNDIPKVGEVLVGYPALANEFLSALINRIAEVRVRSAEFNNAYAMLKKGYLEYGETVENVFVQITKAREFRVDKAPAREFAVTKPQVQAEFYSMNYRVQYPVSITDEEFRMAFLSASTVEDFIARIVSAVTTAAEYDEFLLFKYLIIKAVAHGKMFPMAVSGSDTKDWAVAFRGMSNKLTFMSDKYNIAGVHTVTPKSSQCIFMDANFNATFDVNVLASAFNMDKADFMGRLFLIDDFTTFDNDRFDEIRAGSNQIASVTSEELALMASVKAIILDEEWFQIYDNLSRFTEQYVASGLYWNYFYNVWKTVASSSYSNAVVFVDSTDASSYLSLPDVINAKIGTLNTDGVNTVFTVEFDAGTLLKGSAVEFVQTSDNTTDGIAVHKYGAFIVPIAKSTAECVVNINGVAYESATRSGAGTDQSPYTYSAADLTIANLTAGGTVYLIPVSD